MRYDAVIFDSDGVLVEPPSSDALRAAAVEAFREVGVADPDDDHIDAVFAGVTVDRLEAVAAAYGFDPAAFWAARDRLAHRRQRAAFRAGDRALYDDFDAVTRLDCPRGVVSSNQHATVEFVLEHFDVAGEFGTYYGRRPTVEHVRRKKPDPHFVECALDDLAADADSAVFVGDSESDVRAADRAGVDSAFVRRSHRDGYDLAVEPTYEIATLADLPRIA